MATKVVSVYDSRTRRRLSGKMAGEGVERCGNAYTSGGDVVCALPKGHRGSHANFFLHGQSVRFMWRVISTDPKGWIDVEGEEATDA